jgi:hypothetical protein
LKIRSFGALEDEWLRRWKEEVKEGDGRGFYIPSTAVASCRNGKTPSMFAGNLESASKQSQLRCCCEFLLELASWCEQLPAAGGVFSMLLLGHVIRSLGKCNQHPHSCRLPFEASGPFRWLIGYYMQDDDRESGSMIYEYLCG